VIINAFLPDDSLACLEARLPAGTVRSVPWACFETRLQNCETHAIIFDPASNGAPSLGDLLELLRKHPPKAAIAYIKTCPRNLRAVLVLSRTHVDFVLHPFRGTGADFKSLIQSANASRLGLECLAYLEKSFSCLPTGVRWALEDVFAHPRRYHCGADLAIKSAQSERSLWDSVRSARLGTPRKLVTVAKVLHGCCYLRESSLDLSEISRRVGYTSPRIFAENVRCLLGCSPLDLSSEIEPRELIQHALEWLYKPPPEDTSRRQRGMLRRSNAKVRTPL